MVAAERPAFSSPPLPLRRRQPSLRTFAAGGGLVASPPPPPVPRPPPSPPLTYLSRLNARFRNGGADGTLADAGVLVHSRRRRGEEDAVGSVLGRVGEPPEPLVVRSSTRGCAPLQRIASASSSRRRRRNRCLVRCRRRVDAGATAIPTPTGAACPAAGSRGCPRGARPAAGPYRSRRPCARGPRSSSHMVSQHEAREEARRAGTPDRPAAARAMLQRGDDGRARVEGGDAGPHRGGRPVKRAD